ncbi:hypothetical protein CCACVL1_08672 [Corchorus capsularis]|uniref:Uncharacterized protein n=1 Tax=Corchorus capsularis TaxID=210143 RepID=A0A1R3IZ86_COCAP|nr:hypothetical protein CCACVL1_08672 [Corchorus capsularis]
MACAAPGIVLCRRTKMAVRSGKNFSCNKSTNHNFNLGIR